MASSDYIFYISGKQYIAVIETNRVCELSQSGHFFINTRDGELYYSNEFIKESFEINSHSWLSKVYRCRKIKSFDLLYTSVAWKRKCYLDILV
jgi:hypothetical protein